MRATRVATAVVCLASITFGQGSLTPPGAPAPTMKTLQQVEPRIDLATVASDSGTQHRITQPGSYYLSDNLVVSNSIGIAISSHDVTLDLNGFKILHAGGQGGKAIFVTGSRVTIKNGSISEFEDAIYVNQSDGLYPFTSSRFENLNISRCTGYGLFVGSESLITDCSFSEVRGAAAVFAAANAIVKNCTTKNSSGGYGFQLSAGADVSNCSAIDSGADGFNAGSNSVFQACSASLNDGVGFELGAGTQLSDCTSIKNGAHGIVVGNGSTLSTCVATHNTEDGISAGTGSTLSDCVASYNTRDGININDQSRLSGCVVNNNTRNGIKAHDNNTLSDCVATFNDADGIKVEDSNVVMNCNCSRNKSAGIYVMWGENRIDGNHVTNNSKGIQIVCGGGDSFTMRNVAASNGDNYIIASGNYTGTINTSLFDAGAWDNFSH